MKKLNAQKMTDFLAISLSGLCLIHCLLFPILVIFLPIFSGSFLVDESFHQLLLILILPTSTIALFLGCRKHRKKTFLLIGGIGLFIMIITAFWGHDLGGEIGEKLFTSLGGVIIAYAHWKNFKLCKKEQHRCCS